MSTIIEQFNLFDPTPLYNTQAVVQRTQITADTLRAWERRYSIPQPQRTKGGHRLYSERDIAIIQWLQAQTQRGLSISQSVTLLFTDQLFEKPTPSQSPINEMCTALYQALISFDKLQAQHLFQAALESYRIEDICLQLIQPLMYLLGEDWYSKKITVAQEHFATLFIRGQLSNLLQKAQTDSQRGTILLLTPAGEYHEIGLQIVALFLLRRGWQVTLLGANIPTPDLIITIQQLNPQLIALSATTYSTVDYIIEVIQTLQALPNCPIIGYGGYAFHQSQRRESIPAYYLGKDAYEACLMVEQVLA